MTVPSVAAALAGLSDRHVLPRLRADRERFGPLATDAALRARFGSAQERDPLSGFLVQATLAWQRSLDWIARKTMKATS